MDTTSPSARVSLFQIGSALTLAASVLLVSCNSDDGGGGFVGGSAPPANVAGSWNIFLDGVSCDGDSFSARPLEIMEQAPGEYLLTVGTDLFESFSLTAQQDGNALTVGGGTVNAGVSFAVPTTVWTLSGNGHKLSGPISVTRTEGGVSCVFEGEIEAFEVDATQTSLAGGDWEWAARTSEVNGSCTTVGEVQPFDATLWPKRQNQFVLDLALSSGEHVQFDASVSGGRLDVFGTEVLANGDEMRIENGSFLQIAAGGASAMGEMHVSVTGSDACEYSATVTALRPSMGEPLRPFVRDAEGAQTLVGVRPEDPSETVVLVESLGSELLGPGTTTAGAARFAEVVERRVPAAGGGARMLRDAMVYTADGDIYWVDLAQRFSVDGTRIVLPPVKVFSGNGTAIEDLTVYSDGAQSTTVVVAERANDQFMIELGIVAPATASALLSSTTEVLGMLMDTSGQYRGMATLLASGSELRRISVEQSSELIATGVTAAAVSPNGAVYYARPGQLAVIDAGETAPTVLDSGPGATYTLGRFDGLTALATREDASGVSLHSRAPGGVLIELAQTTSVGAGGADFSDLVPAGEHIVFSMRGGSGTRRVMAVPKAGGTFELLVPAPNALDYDFSGAQAMNGIVYFSGASSVIGLDPTGVTSPEELATFALQAPLVVDEIEDAGLGSIEALTLTGGSGELRLLRRGDPANAPLSGASTEFTSSLSNPELVLAPMGSWLLFANREASQTSDLSASLYRIDLAAGGAPVLISGQAGELNLPVR